MQRIPKAVALLLIGAFAAMATPAIAERVVRYARNADRVDGLHAVRSSTTRLERAHKLVATDRNGRLPSGIVGTVSNARRLGGKPASAYESSPCTAHVAAHAFVPADIDPGESVGIAFVHQDVGQDGSGNRIYSCEQREVTATRVGTGAYEVDFGGAASCLNGAPPVQLRVNVTIKAEEGTPLVANTSSVCRDSGRMVELVRVLQASGSPADSAFVVTLMGTLPIPPIP